MASAVGAEIGAVDQDVSVAEDTAPQPPIGDLETELKHALAVQLTRPQPENASVPSSAEEMNEGPSTDSSASRLEPTQNTGAPIGEMRLEAAAPTTDAKQSQPEGRTKDRTGRWWLIALIVIIALIAAFLYRKEIGVFATSAFALLSTQP